MSELKVENMTPGQLKLEYASCCQTHGADGVTALGWAGTMETPALRKALLDYYAACERDDWTAAEDALLDVLPEHLKAGIVQ
jgi:hypothetical protein